jgi:hypothetical protein
VAYTHIYKSNSDNIFNALISSDPRGENVHSWKGLRNIFTSKTTSKMQLQAKDLFNTRDVKSFTFIRDPLRHFLSGLAESTFRMFNNLNGTEKNDEVNDPQKIKEHIYDVESAKRLLDAILNGPSSYVTSHLAIRSHYMVQSYAVLNHRPHFIGKPAVYLLYHCKLVYLSSNVMCILHGLIIFCFHRLCGILW